MDKAKRTVLMCALLPTLAGFGEMAVKPGECIAFLGDSITYHGQRRGDGYVNLVLKAIDAEGVAVEAVKAGVSGNNSRDMLARLDRDVLSKKPNWMTLSCGINDVWNLGNANGKGVELDEFRRNVGEILDRCAASNCTVVVMTTTLFESRGKSAAVSEKDERNVRIAAYNDFLRAEARQRGLPLADVNEACWKSHRAGPGDAGLGEAGSRRLGLGGGGRADGLRELVRLPLQWRGVVPPRDRDSPRMGGQRPRPRASGH